MEMAVLEQFDITDSWFILQRSDMNIEKCSFNNADNALRF